MRIEFEELRKKFEGILIKKGVEKADALLASTLFAETSLDGIYSHGANRFPRIMDYIDKGYIKVNQKPTLLNSFGSFERLDGNMGLGNINASIAMNRACVLASKNGIGIVAMRNTNHWLRGGSYGWQAANNGFIGICWTNTWPNMPAWGGVEPKIGNNPFVIAVPRGKTDHIVLDCAMSQFAFGKIEDSRMKNIMLPVPGGFDIEGNITNDPKKIEESGRVLPIGFWKGSGLSIVLDLVASVLSDGSSVTNIGKSKDEIGLSQIFIAIDPKTMNTKDITDRIINEVITDIKSATPIKQGDNILYPGELEKITREDNLKNGIPILEEVWDKLNSL